MSYPLIFGEVLFDQFEDGNSVLGGAPFNVAWHLTGLGLQPRMLTRIGTDANASAVQAAMHDWRMSDELVQLDPDKATGTVQVKMQQGQHRFEIVQDVAYDYIAPPATATLARLGAPALLYHGSLVARNSTSRATLRHLRESLHCPVFVDINLRAPWWDAQTVDMLIDGATWLKINDEELHTLVTTGNDLQGKAKQLLAQKQLAAVIVTRGAQGAFVQTRDALISCEPVRVARLVDTVGAGDAFSAIMIAGLLKGIDYRTSIELAAEFAARICEQRGATVHDRRFYEYYIERLAV